MQNSLRMTLGTVLFAAVTLGAGVFLAGCGTQSEQGPKELAQGTSSCCPASAVDAHDAHDDHDDHGHQHAAEGPHGGQLIELGDGQYRAELVHDKAAHTVTVYLLDAKAKEPAASDQTEITLQLFEDGQFGDYTLEAVPGDAGEAGPSQFAIVNEKLSDALLGSDEVRGRLQVSIQGKPLTGIIERHSHEQGHHDNDDPDHDHDEHDHDEHDHDEHDHDEHDHDEHDHDEHDHDKG